MKALREKSMFFFLEKRTLAVEGKPDEQSEP